jgi:aminoglycoside 6'-N-acetyltransferase-1b/aminoglycoside 6'-N-acetyltransferase-2
MFEFHPFAEAHLTILKDWLKRDHIRPVWQEPEDESEFKEKFLNQLPQRSVYAFIIYFEHHPIGYLQYYNANKVGGGWWENEKPGTFGVDLMIGEEKLLGRGYGATIITEFLSLIKAREESVTSFIIDPDPSNHRAIKSFEKAGFIRESDIQTPGGAAVLMRHKVK